MDRVPITKAGYEKLQEELIRLQTRDMPEVVKAIGLAREFGDISENAEYHAAKERQGLIMAKIADLKTKLGQAEITDPPRPDGRVIFGALVTVCDLDQDQEFCYRLVGPFESDVSKGEIAFNSPIGRALLGKGEGDEIKVATPKGTRRLEILEVR